MPGQADAKRAALAASRTLNSDPQKVTDPAFSAGGFFDPADLLQVKYEMVRRVEVEGVPVSAAARAFGFARQSVYNARAALADGGLAALIPGKPGPRGGHKLTAEVLDHLEALLGQDPRLSYDDLAAAAAQRFTVTVHPRSVRRALDKRAAVRQDSDSPPGPAAPKSRPRG
jgi:transposase